MQEGRRGRAGRGRGPGPGEQGGLGGAGSVWGRGPRAEGGVLGLGRGIALIGPALPFWMPLPPLPPPHWLPCLSAPPLPPSGLQHQETVIIFAPVLNAVAVPGLSPLPPYLPHLHLRSPPYLPEPWSLP